MTKTNWKDVPLPKRMQALGRDHRGYPIPFIVVRDLDNRPHFTINDTYKVERCKKEKRCAICGNRLDKTMWFVGGPMSAFHVDGAYLDTAMHYECMAYSLQVCPYLAMPKYLGRIDTATIDPKRVPVDMVILLDHTIIPERPSVFVAVESTRVTFTEMGYSRPVRPYTRVEYWKDGRRVEDEEERDRLVEQGMGAMR